jgi:hypothetical protein
MESPVNINAGIDYIRKFRKNKDNEFTIRTNYETGATDHFLTSEQNNPGTDRFVINNSNSENKQYTIQSDYTVMFKNKSKFEAGIKTIFRRASSDFESLTKYNTLDEYKKDPANTDYFEYSQNVYSVYSTYNFKIKKTSLRIEIRTEQTVIDGKFFSSSTRVKQQYTSFVPNFLASTPAGKNLTMVFSYSQRLQRPFISSLNPFINNNDSLNISYGNPGLDAQVIHNMSLQTRISKKIIFFRLICECQLYR